MNLWPNFDLKFDPILQGKKGKKTARKSTKLKYGQNRDQK